MLMHHIEVPLYTLLDSSFRIFHEWELQGHSPSSLTATSLDLIHWSCNPFTPARLTQRSQGAGKPTRWGLFPGQRPPTLQGEDKRTNNM